MEKHINLIKKLAWSFHRSTGIEFDDLFQEAYLAYDYALKTYDPKKGKITTYMWWCIVAQLKRYIYKQEEYKCKKYQEGVILSIDETVDIPFDNIPFWESLTEEAYEIANIILQGPKPYLETSDKTKIDKRIIEVMSNKGWKLWKIYRGLHELKLAFL